MLSAETAEVLAGMRPQRWPDPNEYPAPEPLDAYLSWRKLAASGLFALLLAAAIAAILSENAMTAEPYQGWRFWIRVLVAAGAAALGSIVLGSAVQALRRSEPLLSLTSSGLSYPGAYERAVPWSEIALVIHDKPRIKMLGGGQIVLGIRDGERFGRRPSSELKPAPRPGGIDVVQLPQLLDVPVDRLSDRLQAYRAHLGPGDRNHDT
jgi:hypothetical protein